MHEFIELTVGLPFQDAALLLYLAGAPIAPGSSHHERIADQPALLFQDLPAEFLANAVTTIPARLAVFPFTAPISIGAGIISPLNSAFCTFPYIQGLLF